MKNKWLARFLAVALVASVLWEPTSIVSATDAMGIPEASEAVQGEGGEESILNSKESSLEWGDSEENAEETSKSEAPKDVDVGERGDSGQEEALQDGQNAEMAGEESVSEADEAGDVISAEEQAVLDNVETEEEVGGENGEGRQPEAYAGDVIASGSYRDVTWGIDAGGKLTVRGTGNFSSLTLQDRAPWYSARESITSAEIDVTGMTNASFMFYNCSNLQSVNLKNFDTKNVSNMWGMFHGCSGLKSVDVSNFDTRRVGNMGEMFQDCSSLTSVDVSNFDTGNVFYMDSMFAGCSSLTSVDVSNFDTGHVRYMDYMFWGCSSLASVDVSNFITGQVMYIERMFQGCSSLTSVNISNFDVGNARMWSEMFSGCSSLRAIITPYNLKRIIALPTNEGMAWYMPDGTQITVLPQNLDYSVEIKQLKIGEVPEEPVIPDNNPKITTTTEDINGSGITRVKYIPYYFKIQTDNTNELNVVTFSISEGRLPGGLTMNEQGEISGVPQEFGEFPLTVKAEYSEEEFQPSVAEIVVMIRDNTDAHVSNASDTGYSFVPSIGEETGMGSYVLRQIEDQIFEVTAPLEGFTEMTDLWLSGEKLTEGEDYVREGNQITLYAQTLQNKAIEGRNTLAAEFRTEGKGVKRAAQNFTIEIQKEEVIHLYRKDSLYQGKSITLFADITLGSASGSNSVEWKSSNSSIVAFDADGADSVKHSISVGSDGKAEASVQLYGISAGRVTITCKLDSGEEKTYRIAVNTDREEVDKLQSFILEWETAFNTYLKKLEQAMAGNAEKALDTAIEEQAEALMKADAESSDKLVRFPDPDTDQKIRKDVYKAVAQFLADNTVREFDLESVDVSDVNATKISIEIVNKICKVIDTDDYSYQFDDANVILRGINVREGIFRQIYYYKGKSDMEHVAQMNSTKAQVSKAVIAYLEELKKLEKKAAREVYSQMQKSLFGKNIKDLAKEAVKAQLLKAIEPYAKTLADSGLGKVSNNLNSCINYFQFAKKLMTLSTPDPQDPFALADTLDSMKSIEFESISISDKIVKKAMKEVDKAAKKLNQAMEDYIYLGKVPVGNSPVDWLKEKYSGLKAMFKCPVNVAVRNSMGEQVGYIGEDDLWFNEDTLYIEQTGDTKVIYSNGVELAFEVIGTGYGDLNCTFEEWEEGTAIGRVNYYDIPICKGKVLSAVVPGKNITAENIMVYEESGQISADESIVFEEYDTSMVHIACTANGAEGQAYGGGEYIRGDAVKLQAVAEDGFVFWGWQDSNGMLMSISQVYEFTAREDIALTALFVEHIEDERTDIVQDECMIAFDANGGTGIMMPIVVKSGSTFTFPECGFTAPDLHEFHVWQIGDAKYAPGDTYVFTDDAIVCAYWTEKSVELPPEPTEIPQPIVTEAPVASPSTEPGATAVPEETPMSSAQPEETPIPSAQPTVTSVPQPSSTPDSGHTNQDTDQSAGGDNVSSDANGGSSDANEINSPKTGEDTLVLWLLAAAMFVCGMAVLGKAIERKVTKDE